MTSEPLSVMTEGLRFLTVYIRFWNMDVTLRWSANNGLAMALNCINTVILIWPAF